MKLKINNSTLHIQHSTLFTLQTDHGGCENMADFEEGLALGLLLVGGGSPAYRSEIFHYIVDTSLIVYSHDINETYSFDAKVFAMKYPDIDFKTDIYGTMGRLATAVKFDASQNKYFTDQRIMLRAQNTIYGAVVVKKDGVPLYAVLTGTLYSNIDSEFRTWEMSPPSGSDTEDFFFLHWDDYKITSTEISGTAAPVPTVQNNSAGGQIVTGQYTGGCNMDFTYSHMEYYGDCRLKPDDITKMQYWIEPYNDGEPYVNSGTLYMNSVNILPVNYYGVYTDLQNSALETELQNVIHAIREEAGLDSYTAKFVRPGDVIEIPSD